ncbi:GNAT family N-acetyltransferase [Chitinispirillales bacterium ANBcel5]|uniref:GNAT family N-acetyltransferase n=1 Tax=Cellulosispirillum alkaliphilum TaxID=3039283 RepID=UPI002A4F86FF|nr:GNAT family N-acetyltransferase [Chitinispirillales bacterium ANBcel5]
MNKETFEIRNAREEDVEEMVKLLAQLFSIEDDFKIDEANQRNGLAALLRDHKRSVVKVAKKNNRVIGLCTAQVSISTAQGGLSAGIEDLIVDKTHRGFGIGTKLLQHITSWALSAGCLRLQLLVDKRNEPALRFYNTLGWNRTHMVCMQKTRSAHSMTFNTITQSENSRR